MIRNHYGLWVPKIRAFFSIAHFWMMVDPWMHGAADPIHADFGDYIFPIAGVPAGGECGTAESVVPVAEIGAKTTNEFC